MSSGKEVLAPPSHRAVGTIWSVDMAGTDQRMGRWARRGVRSVLAGMAAIGLAFTTVPLLAVSVVALALAPVPFLGLALVPWTMTLVRMRADLERRRASQTGVLVTRPYLPAPERAVAGGWPRFRWTVTDPATWRDLAWLAPGAVVGFTLGTVSVLVPLYGLAGLTLTPFWVLLGTGWSTHPRTPAPATCPPRPLFLPPSPPPPPPPRSGPP